VTGRHHHPVNTDTAAAREKYRSVKEIIIAMDALGQRFSELAVRARMRAGIPRISYSCRLSDFIAFCEKNPDFKTRRAKPAKSRRIPATSI
jgi:hypothetical protein